MGLNSDGLGLRGWALMQACRRSSVEQWRVGLMLGGEAPMLDLRQGFQGPG